MENYCCAAKDVGQKYKKVVKRYLRRLKRCRKVNTRYDKLDIVFRAVISLAVMLYAVLI